MYEVPYIFALTVSRTVSRTGGVDGARKGWPTSVAGLHLGPGRLPPVGVDGLWECVQWWKRAARVVLLLSYI